MATFASPIILLFLGGFFLALEAIDARGGHIVLLICDHVMPGKTGIDFLSVVADDIHYGNTRNLVLTGLATHQDTIKAINRADVDYYVEKPWDRVRLVEVVRAEVTEYILRAGISYQPYIEVLDQEIIYAYLRTRT